MQQEAPARILHKFLELLNTNRIRSFTTTNNEMSAAKGRVLVVGGSSGMGKAAAIAAARSGYTVHIAGTSAEKLEGARKEIIRESSAAESNVEHSVVDATNPDSLRQFSLSFSPGSLQHLVVTVGPSASSSTVIGEDGFQSLRRQFDLKFFAQLGVVSYIAPLLADGGAIVLTSGALAKRPGKGGTALATANAALDAVVKGLANDLGPRLRVNTLSPGLVDTEMFDGMPPGAKDAMLRDFGSKIPAGRAGVPADIGAAVLFLLENSWITGTVLDVDGGAAVRP